MLTVDTLLAKPLALVAYVTARTPNLALSAVFTRPRGP